MYLIGGIRITLHNRRTLRVHSASSLHIAPSLAGATCTLLRPGLVLCTHSASPELTRYVRSAIPAGARTELRDIYLRAPNANFNI